MPQFDSDNDTDIEDSHCDETDPSPLHCKINAKKTKIDDSSHWLFEKAKTRGAKVIF